MVLICIKQYIKDHPGCTGEKLSEIFPDYIQEYKNKLNEMISDIPSEIFSNIKAQVILQNTEYDGYDKRKVLEAEIFKDMKKYITDENTVNINTLFT